MVTLSTTIQRSLLIENNRHGAKFPHLRMENKQKKVSKPRIEPATSSIIKLATSSIDDASP
jgi:hypothetical protein